GAADTWWHVPQRCACSATEVNPYRSPEIIHVVQTFRLRRRGTIRIIPAAVCPGAGRGWRNTRLGIMAKAELGAALAGANRGAGWYPIRPEHQRNPGELHGQDASGHHDQRLRARTDPAL